MKKLLGPAIALLALSVTAFASTNVSPTLETPVATVVSPTAAQLVEKFGDKLDHYITALASKAGVAADHFWPIFVKQQMIEGIYVGCLWCIGFLIALTSLTIAMRNYPNSANEDLEKQHPTSTPKTIIGFIVFAVLTGICAISAMAMGQEIISKIFNPEYHAVQSLVNMVK